MSDKKYEIEIPSDSTEAREFCKYLNEQGHTATIGRTTGSFLDGVQTDHSTEASEAMRTLWDEYCNS